MRFHCPHGEVGSTRPSRYFVRVGPEWDYGGIPAWVGLKKGIVLRWLNPVGTQYNVVRAAYVFETVDHM